MSRMLKPILEEKDGVDLDLMCLKSRGILQITDHRASNPRQAHTAGQDIPEEVLVFEHIQHRRTSQLLPLFSPAFASYFHYYLTY